MNANKLEDIHDRAIDEHRRSTLYVAGFAVALAIVVFAVVAATLIVARVVRG